jgi:hypothetical protein
VPEKHKNLKVSMRFTQKNLYKKTTEKKRDPLLRVWGFGGARKT